MDEDFGEDILERGVAMVTGKKKGKTKQMTTGDPPGTGCPFLYECDEDCTDCPRDRKRRLALGRVDRKVDIRRRGGLSAITRERNKMRGQGIHTYRRWL